MSIVLDHHPQARRSAHDEPAIRIFERLMRGFDGFAALRLWNDTVHAPSGGTATFTLVLRDPALLRRLVLGRSPLLLADAYFHGQLDFEGDLYSALTLKDHFQRVSLSWRDKLALLRDAWRLPSRSDASLKPSNTMASRIARSFSHRHSRKSDRAAISFHYDVSNEFYGLWLDEQRVYSCAYFESPNDTLEQAQRNKLEHICRKLRLRPGERRTFRYFVPVDALPSGSMLTVSAELRYHKMGDPDARRFGFALSEVIHTIVRTEQAIRREGADR